MKPKISLRAVNRNEGEQLEMLSDEAEADIRSTVAAVKKAADSANVSNEVLVTECRKHLVLLMNEGIENAEEDNPAATEEDIKEARRILYVVVAQAFQDEFGIPF